METKTVSKCLNFFDEVLKDGISSFSIAQLEYIHDYMTTYESEDCTDVLSCINIIIESYYFKYKGTHFETLSRHLRKEIMKRLHNCKNPFNNVKNDGDDNDD